MKLRSAAKCPTWRSVITRVGLPAAEFISFKLHAGLWKQLPAGHLDELRGAFVRIVPDCDVSDEMIEQYRAAFVGHGAHVRVMPKPAAPKMIHFPEAAKAAMSSTSVREIVARLLAEEEQTIAKMLRRERSEDFEAVQSIVDAALTKAGL